MAKQTAAAPPQVEDLRISEDLTLPIGAVVETFAILGKRGKGKTGTAVVLAEEMIRAGLPVLIVDPVGVWWGLRSSADGKGEGLPVVIFGGDHADIPLTDKAGTVVADAIIDGRFPAILDLSHLSKAAMRRVMADFVERLYHSNREALHVIFDEADLLAPQRTSPEGNRLLGAMEDLQRRGRARGIGTTLISQRPAVLHKDLLSQAEVLIALGLTGPRDVAAIDEWVRLHADEDQARQVKQTLASLPVGTAWVWSPAWLGILEKVQIRPRDTFDSSATPQPGVARPAATAFAQVDKAALGEKISELEAEIASDDPKVLRGRIAQLERELAKASTAARVVETVVEKTVEVPVEVPVLAPGDVDRLEAIARELLEKLNGAPVAQPRLQSLTSGGGAPRTPAPTPAPTPAARPQRAAPATKQVIEVANPTGALPKAQRLILTALAQQGPLTAVQAALLTSYSHKSGGFRNALSSLRSAGYIYGSGTTGMEITATGREALGSYDALPTGDELLQWWKANHLGKAERAIVDVLRERWPAAVSTEEIAAATGYSPASGGFRNALSKLRSLRVARNAAPGVLELDEHLVDGGTR